MPARVQDASCTAPGAAARAGCGAGGVSGLERWCSCAPAVSLGVKHSSWKCPWSQCFSPCPWLLFPFVLVGSQRNQHRLNEFRMGANGGFLCLQPHPELQMRSVIYVFMLF